MSNSLAAKSAGRTAGPDPQRQWVAGMAAMIAITAIAIGGAEDAQAHHGAEAWKARDAGDWVGCARQFGEAAHKAYKKKNVEAAARNAYWTARCARAAGRMEQARAWAQWTARIGPLTLHGALTRGTAKKRTQPGSKEMLVESIIFVESAGDPKAVSKAGAIGLMQIMPKTARELLDNEQPWTCLWDGKCNRALGQRYLEQLLKRHSGNIIDALIAYNAGPSRAQKWKGKRTTDPMEYIDRLPYGETRRYVAQVLAELARREGGDSMTLAQLSAGQWPKRKSIE